MGKAFTEAEKTAIKTQIIDAATILFRENSYKEVKVDLIAKTVGIGKGTIYLFYPSKEHIFIEVMMKFEQNLHESIEKAIENINEPKERVRESLKLGMAQINDNQIYNAISDKSIMDKIFKLLSPEQVECMASADVIFLEKLLNHAPLKIEIPVALDLLRGVFFMRLFEDQLMTTYEIFVTHYIEAVLNQIF